MRALKTMLFSAWAGGRGEKGREGKRVRSSRFRVQTSVILLLNVLDSRLCLQRSNLPVSLAGRHREKRHAKFGEFSDPRRFLQENLHGSAPPVCSCPPHPTSHCGTRARPSQKQPREQEGCFFPAAKTSGREIRWDPTG